MTSGAFFDPGRFRKVLSELTWVADVVALDATVSTNDDAAALAADGAPEGTVVVAGRQSGGRGRLGRGWVSEAGRGLLASWVVRPNWPVERWPLLTIAAALAAADAVRSATGLSPSLKWPNDVMLGTRKLAGVLAEARPPDFVVVGLGLNLSGRVPPEVAPAAVTLEEAGTQNSDGATLLRETLRGFAGAMADPDDLLPRYRAACATLGRRVRVETADGHVEGTAEDVDHSGALILRTGGERRRLAAGDVVHLRPA